MYISSTRLNIPNIAKNLDDPITESKIQVLIKSMKPGKSPGPDGFTVGFYKAFSPILAPTLTKLFNDSSFQWAALFLLYLRLLFICSLKRIKIIPPAVVIDQNQTKPFECRF